MWPGVVLDRVQHRLAQPDVSLKHKRYHLKDHGETEKLADHVEIIKDGNPWRVEKRGEKYVVVKTSDGSVVGTHDTKEEALAQQRALEASEKD